MNSIHKGEIVSVQSFGAFVRLGDGDKYKDGLLHISRLSASGRVDKVEDVVNQGDKCIVKVCDIKAEDGKYSVDMRFVNQRTGEDQDSNNVLAGSSGGGKGGGKGGSGPPPITIGAVQNTTCSKCGAKGHMARECFNRAGSQYDLIEDPLDEPNDQRYVDDLPPSKESRKAVEEALWTQMKKHRPDLATSSSSDSSSSKAKKKQKKKEKKAKKKDKKQKKKREEVAEKGKQS